MQQLAVHSALIAWRCRRMLAGLSMALLLASFACQRGDLPSVGSAVDSVAVSVEGESSVAFLNNGCALVPSTGSGTSYPESGQALITSAGAARDTALQGLFTAIPVLTDLEMPVAWAVLPDGRLLYTEQHTGRIRLVEDGHVREEPLLQVPDAASAWEGGMLGLAVHPQFPQEPYLYLYYTAKEEVDGEDYLRNRLVRFLLVGDQVLDEEVLLDDIPSSVYHNGGILLFGPDEKLYVSIGDSHTDTSAQDVDSLSGKVLRMEPDGAVPADNPFEGSYVYSYGHRNIFGMAFHPPTDVLVVTENGPDCCDEVNAVFPGKNYGWPEVMGLVYDARFEEPLLEFIQVIAPTQAVFYTGDRLPLYEDFLFADFNQGQIHRVVLDEQDVTKVLFYEVLLKAPAPLIGLFQDVAGDVFFSTTTTLCQIQLGPSLPVVSQAPVERPRR